ncbi:hypothetical protein [Bdellovibrio reynosensis]|uniref:Uncharacterized protein n=1 Tax=Bdellovibrio reynosensis TaxID=2835041 RepID=A0ABY4CDS1_9BACT|nr:hypothetical protein [Bdellovibrio reynosensis]UOF01816.1 hypothetical protein MNR06_02470 [Bdellovibrio reynosensis]
MLKTVRNSAGNVLLQILAATAVMSTSFYVLTNQVIGQKEQVSKTANLVNLKFALNSAMDYVIFGVRQKYCFTNDDKLLNDANITQSGSNVSKCNLTHPGSVERLIMSTEQENFIRNLIASGQNVGPVNANQIHLDSMRAYISSDAATTEHPLFPVLKSLRMVKGPDGQAIAVSGIWIELTRDNSEYLPRSGREVYLTARVYLVANKAENEAISLGNKTAELVSQIVIYPREVGSFALLVPNDLHLDTSWDAIMDKGDVAIHKFGSRKDLGASQGLVFQSPVFVNRHLYVPYDSGTGDATDTSIPYSAVTFADRVYLGNGWVRSANKEYSPRSAGGTTDRYWADARTFGGFLKGIENDGGADAGLQYFAKMVTGTQPNTELMSKCTEYEQNKASAKFLLSTEMGARLRESTTNDFDYRLFLSSGNYFKKQSNALILDKSAWGTGTAVVSSNDYNDAVVSLKIVVGERAVEAQFPREAKGKFVVQVGSPELLASYKGAVNSTKSTYDAAKTKYSDYESQLSSLNKSLKIAKEKLAEEEAKPVEPKKSSTTTTTTMTAQGTSTQKSATVEESAAVDDSGGSSSSSKGKGKDVVVEEEEEKVDYQNPKVIAQLEKEIDGLNKNIADLKNNKMPSQQSLIDQASKAYDSAKSDLNKYELIVANPPVIEIATSKVNSYYGFTAYDKLNLDVNVKNPKNLLDKNGNLVAPVVRIQAYDSTYYNSMSTSKTPNQNLVGYLNFEFDGSKTNLVAPYSVSRKADSSAIALNEGEQDWAAFEQECQEARNAQTSQSFGGAGWDVSFASGTRTSWNFAGGQKIGKDPGIDKMSFENQTRANATFQVRSIVGACVITKTSDFITGFFACDSLEIEERSTPLRIIGTFIVGKMRIHPTAIKAGISWSSIYHPQAYKELRGANGVLRSMSGRDCNAANNEPIWHPIPSVQTVADRMTCNTISLRAKADPFQWTAVDPDCGINPNKKSSNTTCKRRLVRFYVVEQSREGSL